jgi:hypothetical protein
MIRHADIVARVAEWQLSHAVIEKDYVLGWLLWVSALIRHCATRGYSRAAPA